MAKKPTYTATAIINGRKHKGEGVSIAHAIQALEGRNAKGRVILTISNGKHSKDRVLMGTQVSRLFNHGLTRDIAIKQISSLFDGI